MLSQRLVSFAVCAAVWLCGPSLTGSVPRLAGAAEQVLISSASAQQYGLQRMWRVQAELDRARNRITHVTQHVSGTVTQTIFDVVYPGGKVSYSERDLDRYGDVLGKERAEKLAREKAEELNQQQIEAKVATVVIPDIAIYVATDGGVLQAIDAETGRTRWVAQLGDPRHPVEEPAASDKYVATVNGSTLYILDQANGKVLWERRVQGVPGAGPAISDQFAYAPMLNGDVEYYYLEDMRLPPAIFKSIGRVTVPPTVTVLGVAWPTDRGHLYMGSNRADAPRFRIETSSTITSAPTPLPGNRLVVASTNGYVYCVHETRQSIIWRFSAGEPISTSPIVVGEAIFVLTDDGGLYRLNSMTGREEWLMPRVRGFLSASQDRLYCLDQTRQIEVLDARSGGRLGSISGVTSDLNVLNTVTDRILLGSRTGVIQAFRETTLERPVIHVSLPEKEAEKPGKGTAKPGTKPSATPQKPAGSPPGDDPFGAPAAPAAGDDPFGAPAAPGAPAAGDDPFAAPGAPAAPGVPAAPGMPAAEPGAAPAGDDPFGAAGDDPFK